MPRLILLTYATESHRELRDSLVYDAVNSHQFDDFLSYSPYEIDEDFYRKNEHILTYKMGKKTTGAFLWKPYFIRKALESINEGDVLLYMDVGDGFFNTKDMREKILSAMENEDMIITPGGYANKLYTHRDCFVLMGCDEPKYWEPIQMEAGIGLYKKTESTLRFVNEWISFGCDHRIIKDTPDGEPPYCGKPNYAGFVAHRHDQSILSNLVIKYNITRASLLRGFIQCNVNEPKI